MVVDLISPDVIVQFAKRCSRDLLELNLENEKHKRSMDDYSTSNALKDMI
jgi:hypothetical protein